MSIKIGDRTLVMGMRFRLTHSSSSTGSISRSRGSIVAGGLFKLDRCVVNGEGEGRQVGGAEVLSMPTSHHIDFSLPSFRGSLRSTHASSGTTSNSSTISGTRRARSAASSSGDGGLILGHALVMNLEHHKTGLDTASDLCFTSLAYGTFAPKRNVVDFSFHSCFFQHSCPHDRRTPVELDGSLDLGRR